MINGVYTAIAIEIEELFDEPTIYFEHLPQGFNAPCFWVRMLDANFELRLGTRHELNLSFEVMYYPSSDDMEELNDVAIKLLWGLEYIYYETILRRGHNISYRIEDGVLHFFITFTLFIYQEQDKVFMQKLYQSYRYKNEGEITDEQGTDGSD